jgi:hypothetical protein
MPMTDLPEAKDMIINPFSAVIFASYLFKEQKLAAAKEDWVVLNANLMDDMGAKAWLNEFLEAISTPRAKHNGHDILNPSLAVKISERLQGEHRPIVTSKSWIQANEKLIDELGNADWLWQLLDVLETGGPQLSK